MADSSKTFESKTAGNRPQALEDLWQLHCSYNGLPRVQTFLPPPPSNKIANKNNLHPGRAACRGPSANPPGPPRPHQPFLGPRFPPARPHAPGAPAPGNRCTCAKPVPQKGFGGQLPRISSARRTGIKVCSAAADGTFTVTPNARQRVFFFSEDLTNPR